MSIKFSGVKGNNRIRLKPKSADAILIAHATVVPGVNDPRVPEQLYDGSYALCLKPSEVSCDGAWEGFLIEGGLDYSVGWTVYLNGVEYGYYDANNPIEDNSEWWNWDGMMSIDWHPSGAIAFFSIKSGNLRIQLKPDRPVPSMLTKTYRDIRIPDTTRISENALIGDDGSVAVCLYSDRRVVEAT